MAFPAPLSGSFAALPAPCPPVPYIYFVTLPLLRPPVTPSICSPFLFPLAFDSPSLAFTRSLVVVDFPLAFSSHPAPRLPPGHSTLFFGPAFLLLVFFLFRPAFKWPSAGGLVCRVSTAVFVLHMPAAPLSFVSVILLSLLSVLLAVPFLLLPFRGSAPAPAALCFLCVFVLSLCPRSFLDTALYLGFLSARLNYFCVIHFAPLTVGSQACLPTCPLVLASFYHCPAVRPVFSPIPCSFLLATVRGILLLPKSQFRWRSVVVFWVLVPLPSCMPPCPSPRVSPCPAGPVFCCPARRWRSLCPHRPSVRLPLSLASGTLAYLRLLNLHHHADFRQPVGSLARPSPRPRLPCLAPVACAIRFPLRLHPLSLSYSVLITHSLEPTWMPAPFTSYVFCVGDVQFFSPLCSGLFGPHG